MKLVGTSTYKKASYLKDAVFAANDGIITTFAVIAGSAGATLSGSVVLILGFANLFADGVSMATGNYLGSKSQSDYEGSKGLGRAEETSPFTHALITFLSFATAGLLPLIPYLLHLEVSFLTSGIIVAIELFVVGLIRGIITTKSWIVSGLEMFLIGGSAAVIAYYVGQLVDKFVI